MDLDYFAVDYKIIVYASISKNKDRPVFADADNASESIDQKSICEYIFIIFDEVVYFNSTKLGSVARFTTEAKNIVPSLAF